MATESIKCKYFPMLPARWHCVGCNVDMANECAKPSPHDADKKICPLCSNPLKSLGIANSIKPFWERIPKFFTYPAKPNTLMYLGALSLSILIGLFVPFLFVFAFIGAFFGVLKYACKCLNYAAQGNLSPPDVFADDNTEFKYISLKQWGILVFIAFVVGMAFSVNKPIGFSTLIFSLLSIPATTMLLAMTGSFFNAINPMKVLHIISGMGKSYLLLYLFLLLMSGSSELIRYWAANIVNPFVLVPFLSFINFYFTIAMFSMMGYALYQYHEKFGFGRVIEVNLAAEGIDIKASGINQDSFLNEIHILVTEGLMEEALKRLKQQLKTAGQNLVYRDKYHSLLKLANNAKGMTEHTTDYMNLLLNQAKVNKGKLINIYTDCLKLNPDYFYPDAKVTVDLAKTAQELFRHADALSLLNKFAQNYPNSDQMPYAYFIAAQLLVDHKQQEAQAKKILSSLLTKYPEHELVPQMQEYLAFLEKLKP